MDLTLAQAALTKTKIKLMSSANMAFFSTVCFSLKHSWDDTLPTAATDGKSLFINPTFFMKLSVDERLFLLLHETLHVCLLHMARLSTRNMRKWNIAADYVINVVLVERGFVMPKGGLLNYKYSGMYSEQVYKLLTDEEAENTPVDMDLRKGNDSEEAVKEMEDIIIRASIQSKESGDKPGTIPGEIQLFLDNLKQPKLPWNRLLQRYLHAKVNSDYTFTRPNRRFFPAYHLPSLYSEGLSDIAIAVDISGSVADAEFAQFVAEAHSILKRMKPEKITVVQFDTEIKAVHTVKSVMELMKIPFKGRGGTAIEPVMAWAQLNRPKVLLIFTDGGFHFHNSNKPKSNVLWLIHNNPGWTAPYGSVIHYKI